MLPATIDHYIFDLDGTLTRATHDFVELRALLGISDEVDILAHGASLSTVARAEHLQKIYHWEQHHAQCAKAQTGASALLAKLQASGTARAILTRNSHALIEATLQAADLAAFFVDMPRLGREDAAAKPSPEGILALCEHWQIGPERVVMIGDHGHDLGAAKQAGATSVHLNVERGPTWPLLTDHEISSLHELC